MKKKILVIDDNPVILKMIEAILENRNYVATTITTGEAGIKEVESSPPDLIILDVVLPDMDGWEVCKVLKRNDNTKNIPIIMLTGKKTGIEHEIKSFDFGADDYLIKPFNTGVLLARIAARLGDGRKEQE